MKKDIGHLIFNFMKNVLIILAFLSFNYYFGQHHEEIFRNTLIENEFLFQKNGFSVQSGESINKYSKTFIKESTENGRTYFIWHTVIYEGYNNLPVQVIITTNLVNVYEFFIQNCRDKKMERYYSTEDLSATYDIAYRDSLWAFGFKTDLSDPMKVYSIFIMR